MRQRSDFLILSILFCVVAIVVVFAAMTGGGQVSTIAARVGPVNSGALSLLFGAFCALWAQNTHRNAWLWFFAGLFLNVFAIAVLLYKNSADVKANLIQSARL